MNHRHFNLQLKVPPTLQQFEVHFRELLREHVDRGHVTVVARWIDDPVRTDLVTVDVARARAVYGALKSLKKSLKLKDRINLELISQQPDVMRPATASETVAEFDDVRDILAKAVADLVLGRAREGEQLAAELDKRCLGIGAHLEAVEEKAPERINRERDRLRVAVAELVEGLPVPEERIAQEIAFLADKLDVTEETVRLRTHLEATRETLDSDGPIGKKLTFLTQEMLREINTIGAKANDAAIAHEVIAMKGELEKIREQVENLE